MSGEPNEEDENEDKEDNMDREMGEVDLKEGGEIEEKQKGPEEKDKDEEVVVWRAHADASERCCAFRHRNRRMRVVERTSRMRILSLRAAKSSLRRILLRLRTKEEKRMRKMVKQESLRSARVLMCDRQFRWRE